MALVSVVLVASIAVGVVLVTTRDVARRSDRRTQKRGGPGVTPTQKK